MTLLAICQALTAAQSLGLDRLDAQLLMLHCLGKLETDRAWLLAHDGDALNESIAQTFRGLCLRRAAGEPLAYIVGYKEFFGLRFAVNAAVLVPRPDTETLVFWALDALENRANPDVLDLGTGSGAVAVAIARRLKCHVTATDFSAQALAVASRNAMQLGASVTLIESSWFANVSARYDLIVSNPPYIAETDPHLTALAYEPVSALTAGRDGLADIRCIVQDAPNHLYIGGWLLLEHGYDQADAVRVMLVKHGFTHVQSRRDLAGIERCSGGKWPG